MFRLIVWNIREWEIAETVRTDHVSVTFRKKWGNCPYEMYMERDTQHTSFKWGKWNPTIESWQQIEETDTPSMVRMTAMLLR